jgi:hypothetical protein
MSLSFTYGRWLQQLFSRQAFPATTSAQLTVLIPATIFLLLSTWLLPLFTLLALSLMAP